MTKHRLFAIANAMLIHIHRLPVQVSLGVYAWEKQAPRRVWADICVEFDGTRAAASDDVADTLDYVEIEAWVLKIAQARHYNLLESLVDTIGKAILALPLVQEVTVELFKDGALAHAESVSVVGSYRK